MTEAARIARHESLCRRCGQCCYEKVLVDGVIFTTTRPCRYYNTTSGLCRVYEKRFEKNPGCLSVEQGTEYGVFPADCPYVAEVEGYAPPRPEALSQAVLRMLDEGMIIGLEELLDAARRHPPGPSETPPRFDARPK